MYNAFGYAVAPYRCYLKNARKILRNIDEESKRPLCRFFEGFVDMSERTTRPIVKPNFNIDFTTLNEKKVPVFETIAMKKPFANLLHFSKNIPFKQPKVLIIAPVSGHFATLLRDTVSRMVIDHDVYITDWKSARDIPIEEGNFSLDNYLEYLIEFMHFIGEGTHVMAVCQPAVQVMALAAVMEANEDPCSPQSIIPMGGPIDTRVSKTKVNLFAERFPLEFFEENFLSYVPAEYKGAGRRVYPGFLQLTAFINMNPHNHYRAHVQYLIDHISRNKPGIKKHVEFYDEYSSVLDMDDVYFIQTIERTFQTYELPRGLMTFHGQFVDLKNIRKAALLAIEAENDDISAPGQTRIALELCSNLHDSKKAYYMQKSVGHYGVFSGSKWRAFVAPQITDFIRKHDLELEVETRSLSFG